MRAVIQRVKATSLSVDGKLISEIPFGLAVYLGIKTGDTRAHAEALAKKIAALRIFEDEHGKMNLSVNDVQGEIMLISQFTLYGDCSHGNRPSSRSFARTSVFDRMDVAIAISRAVNALSVVEVSVPFAA